MKKIFLVILFLSITFNQYLIAQGTWTQKADFGGVERYWGTGFSIGNKGYLGMGWNISIFYSDFWEFDPATNSWSQKADYPGANKFAQTGFSIGTKGYVVAGRSGLQSITNLCWEYDPTTNMWAQKNNFGGAPRQTTASFVIGMKAYVCGGSDLSSNTFGDLWEYDPASDIWQQKANFGGVPRLHPTGFSVGGNGYVGGGYIPGTQYPDFWEYNPTTDAWIQKATFPGGAYGNIKSFSIGSEGYFFNGSGLSNAALTEMWRYNPLLNTWTADTPIPVNRNTSVSFVISNKGYYGTGVTSGPTSYHKDFYEFSPGGTTGLNQSQITYDVNVFPNPTSGTIKIEMDAVHTSLEVSVHDVFGRLIQREQTNNAQSIQLNIDGPTGIYIVSIETERGKKTSRVIKQ